MGEHAIVSHFLLKGFPFALSKPGLFHTDDEDSTLTIGLTNGGPAGLVYGFLAAWVGATLQSLVFAEMASMCVVSSRPSKSLREWFSRLGVLFIELGH